MAVYNGKPEKGQRTVRTMIGALVPALLLIAGQAMAQLTSEGNQIWHQDSDSIAGQAQPQVRRGDDQPSVWDQGSEPGARARGLCHLHCQ